jgi:hypothetical protein
MIRLGLLMISAGILAGMQPAPAQNGMHMQHMQQLAPPAATGISEDTSRVQDTRELVSLPEPMQEHMLSNMRDHLVTLNEIIGEIADGKLDVAAKLSEQRLGMSSLGLHDAAHLAPFMPKPMQDFGISMHRAASRLAITLQNAAVSPSLDTMAEVNRGLHDMTTACTACHASYRIR